MMIFYFLSKFLTGCLVLAFIVAILGFLYWYHERFEVRRTILVVIALVLSVFSVYYLGDFTIRLLF